MTKEEISNQINLIKKHFGDVLRIKPSVSELRKYFKDDYSDILGEGTKCLVDLHRFFMFDQSRDWKGLFNNNPWQNITITYRRCDLVFFTWDDYPQYDEEYFSYTSSDWPRIVFPKEVKYSDIFKNKIKRMRATNPDELTIQMNVLDIDDLKGKIKVIKDI